MTALVEAGAAGALAYVATTALLARVRPRRLAPAAALALLAAAGAWLWCSPWPVLPPCADEGARATTGGR